MTTAFVFAGGGSLGSIEAGMLLALAERGVEADFTVGASVGAINAAWYSAHPGLDGARRLTDIWRGVGRSDVFPIEPINGLLGFVGLHDSFISSDALRSKLVEHLDVKDFGATRLPAYLIAADLATGQEVVVDHGDLLDALCASSAIPGIFPPVEIDGRYLVDGGVVNNAPVSVAVEQGADEIWVLPTGYACALGAKPHGAFGVAMQALTLMIHTRLQVDVLRYRDHCDIRVAPPLCPLNVLPIDFSHTGELIERAHTQTAEWLEKHEKDGWVSRHDVLGLHSHEVDGIVAMQERVRPTPDAEWAEASR